MKTILLALSTTRHSPKTIEYALKQARKESARLAILFIVDPDLPKLILDKMMDVGFMGDKPSFELQKSILKEYKERGKKITKQISEKPKTLGLEWLTIIAEGEFTKECMKVIEKEKPEKIILTRAQRSRLSRFLFGSEVNKLKQKSPSPIKIVEEEPS